MKKKRGIELKKKVKKPGLNKKTVKVGEICYPMMNRKRAIIQTVNGVHLPPRKKFSPEKTLVLRFVFPGTLPSKKNNYVPDKNWKKMQSILEKNLGKPVTPDLIKQIQDVKPFIRKAERFKEWEEEMKPVILEQAAKWQASYNHYGLTYPITKCSISIYHYWKDKQPRDNSNKAESVHDLFVDLNLISSDSHACLRKNSGEADVYRGEIRDHITMVTLCAYEW